ncbi:hypothetical protein CTEN210_04237 [Chaetoceros tenuissimus]|uniref:Peptidase M12B domain-containing protein n=1 Tax=Chaetoceros tenuissimus TaxID=426638 RepID=A0AAD3H234_9STRA|nr:hypothetical protein CTEN210_04237 [Chaetoceros tenuissimus]
MKLPLAATIVVSTLSFAAAQNCGFAIANKGQSIAAEKRPVDLSALAKGCDSNKFIQVDTPRGRKKFNNKPNAAAKGFYGVTDDGSTLQYIRGENDTVFGSLVDIEDGTVTQISVDYEGNQVMETTKSLDFPPEQDPPEIDAPELKVKTADVSLVEDISSIETKSLQGGSTGASRALSLFPIEDTDMQSRSLVDDGSTLDILIVWTQAAECENSGQFDLELCTLTETTRNNMLGIVDLAISETNTAYANSNISTALRAVNPQRIDYVESDSLTALNDITGTTDGKMDLVHTLRADAKADLVGLFVKSGGGCGIAWRPTTPTPDLMFSVTNWNCATGNYSFGHEVGHNLGCKHDRGTSNECSNSGYNYGFRDPAGNFRSVMAYNCVSGQCDNNAAPNTFCTRVNWFSNDYGPDFEYNNSPIGNTQNDCARRINDVKLQVSRFFDSGASPSPSQVPTISLQPSISPFPTTTGPQCGNSVCERECGSCASDCFRSTDCGSLVSSGSGNRSPSLFGQAFNVDVFEDVYFHEAESFVFIETTANFNVKVYTKEGSYVDSSNLNDWNLVFNGSFNVPNQFLGYITLPFTEIQQSLKNTVRAFYITLDTGSITLFENFATSQASNGDLAMNTPFLRNQVIGSTMGSELNFGTAVTEPKYLGTLKYGYIPSPPQTSNPTLSPSSVPSSSPTDSSEAPSSGPSSLPSSSPSMSSDKPSLSPSSVPSSSPTDSSEAPSSGPSSLPSSSPSMSSDKPSLSPSSVPSSSPTDSSEAPSSGHSSLPSSSPSMSSDKPSLSPSSVPSLSGPSSLPKFLVLQ